MNSKEVVGVILRKATEEAWYIRFRFQFKFQPYRKENNPKPQPVKIFLMIQKGRKQERKKEPQ